MTKGPLDRLIKSIKDIFNTMGRGFEAGNRVDWPSATFLNKEKNQLSRR
jgi:hypothetical protein